jgi:hypothetical protein
MTYLGMDTARVGELADRFTLVAERIRALETTLSGRVAAASWIGPDRTRFAETWTRDHAAGLREAAAALDDAARLAAAQAREQDAASS